MQGTVKWFSNEKGFGFIVGADGTERYFNVRSVKGAVLPRAGATVAFSPSDGRRGPAAVEVEILSQAVRDSDDRVVCPHCAKRIVPRIISSGGELSHSVCPFCGGTIKSFRSRWPLLSFWRWRSLSFSLVQRCSMAQSAGRV